jgi:hypothetical protein
MEPFMCKPYLLLLFILIYANVHAQTKWFSGYLKDSVTNLPVSGGTVINFNTQKKVQSDRRGFFRLQATPNDVLYVTAPSYRFDTLRFSYLFADTITIHLFPVGHVLPGVTVAAHYNQYQIDSVERRKAFEQLQGQKVSTVSSTNNGAFGVGLNLDKLFKKKYKDQKKSEKLFVSTEEQAYVNYRFSSQMVADYTGLKDEPLRDFLYRYTPSYKWLRQHPSDDEVLYYINDKIKEYRGSKR